MLVYLEDEEKKKEKKEEKEKRITVYFINNEHISLSATMPTSVYNKHKQFIIFLQIISNILKFLIIIIFSYICLTK
jgi:hypothetical protein